eukprot:TRINITY_DN6156_c0_g1_i2.p1 TRINITY_DN6156_c0_g1~~TRINITY_DN6156_c0_g1_i2.p1  ORF type:complete len:134 (-),score=15.01 TRINITY_DN6156_c0_g1_i2:8-409(-)
MNRATLWNHLKADGTTIPHKMRSKLLLNWLVTKKRVRRVKPKPYIHGESWAYRVDEQNEIKHDSKVKPCRRFPPEFANLKQVLSILKNQHPKPQTHEEGEPKEQDTSPKKSTKKGRVVDAEVIDAEVSHSTIN